MDARLGTLCAGFTHRAEARFRSATVLSFLPPFILGPFSFLLFLLNTAFWGTLLFLLIPAKVLVPSRPWKTGCTRLMTGVAEAWTSWNNLGLDLTQRIRWDVQGADHLSRRSSYLVSCNHQSWVDIVVLQKVLNRRVPFPKFFLKRGLAWVPVLGQAWWALDYPFMRRHSREYLEAHPEKRGEDLETTRRACERFQGTPVTILNFLEGTRFTRVKHDLQASPYRHLLLPKAGGIAFVLESMGGRLKSLLDVTVVYPEKRARFWDLFTGRIGRVVVRVQELSIPEEFLHGGYLEDAHLRERFQAWVRQLWQEKDALIDRIMGEGGGSPTQTPS